MFNQITQWFAMGGYGAYIWPAYGMVAAVLLLNVYTVKKQKNRTLNQLQQWFKN